MNAKINTKINTVLGFLNLMACIMLALVFSLPEWFSIAPASWNVLLVFLFVLNAVLAAVNIKEVDYDECVCFL